MTDAEQVANLAVDFILFAMAAQEAKRARNAKVCLHMAPPTDEEGMAGPLHPDGKPWQPQPCWTVHHEPTPDGYGATVEPYGDNSERGWCEGCRERQRLHKSHLSAVRYRAAAIVKLRSRVLSVEWVTP